VPGPECRRPAHWRAFAAHVVRQILDRANILCTGALGAPAFVKRDPLSFTEIVVLHAFDVRHVEEQVSATAGVDETESLSVNFLIVPSAIGTSSNTANETHRNRSACTSPASGNSLSMSEVGQHIV
jgi:hypothetical protein